MLKNRGIFSYFPGLSNIEVSKVASWFSVGNNPQVLENKLGNRMLYPQAVPLSHEDLKFDLCLLREALHLQPQNYYNQNLKRIYIPSEFLEFFPNWQELALAFVDILGPLGITSIITNTDHGGFKNLGTLIKPEVQSENGKGNIIFFVQGKKYQIKAGSLTVVPTSSSKVDIKFESDIARLLGHNSLTLEVAGGILGVIVDGRKGKK